MKTASLICTPLLVLLALSVQAQPVPDVEWTFNDPANPLAAVSGEALELTGEHSAADGITPGDGAYAIGDGSYYIARHGFAANGGGDFVNQYSIVMDVQIPGIGVPYALYNSNASNGNAAEAEITPEGLLGNRFDTGTEPLIPGAWYRLIIAADLANGEIRYYVDGALYHTSPGFSLDGGFALWSATDETPWLTLFSAPEGETSTIHVSYVALYDEALSEADAASLPFATGDAQPAQTVELPDPTGVWDFPTDTPLLATTGANLELEGNHEIVPGINSTDGAAAVFPGSYYIARHNLEPNGGGGFVNLYSLVLDVKISQLGQSYALFNTNAGNANSAEAEITPEGFLGNRFDAGETVVTPGLWHRIVIAADLVSGEFRYYLNGEKVHTSLEFSLDGGFALWSVFDETPWLTLFSDVDGEDSTIFVTRAAVYGEPLTDEQAAALAGPLGLPGPVEGLPIIADPPATPSIVSVSETPSGLDDVVLAGSDFVNEGGAQHLSSRWELALDVNFQIPYLSVDTQTHLTTFSVPNFRIPFGVPLYARVQYTNDTGVTSEFSEPATFTLSPPAGYSLLFEETFESAEVNSLPEGWSELSFTDDPGSGDGLDTYNPELITWVTKDPAGLDAMPSYPHSESLFQSELPLLESKAVVANSGDFASVNTIVYEAHLFSPPVDASGYTDVIVTFNSHYVQNQDNIAVLEYTIDGGTVDDTGLNGTTGEGTWLPLAYHLDERDVTFAEDGTVDGLATFDFLNFADGTPFAYVDYVLASGSQSGEELAALGPFIYPVEEESIDGTDGLRYNRYALSEADNASDIVLRWMYQGTWSWYWAIDNVQVWGFSETSVTDWALFD